MTHSEMKMEMECIIKDFNKRVQLPDEIEAIEFSDQNKYIEHLTKASHQNMLKVAERIRQMYRENDVPDDINEMLLDSRCGVQFFRIFGYGFLENDDLKMSSNIA